MQDTDAEWPSELSVQLRRQLEKLAETVAQARSMQDTLLHSNMKKDAKAIATAAAKLLEKVRDFSKNYEVAKYENYRTSAIETINDDFGGFSDDHLNRCRMGMDESLLQWPLLGLNNYMRVLAAIPGKAGPRKANLERYAVEETIKIFKRDGLPISSSENGLLFRACRAVLAQSGFVPRRSRIIAKRGDDPDIDEALKHYIRQINGAKT